MGLIEAWDISNAHAPACAISHHYLNCTPSVTVLAGFQALASLSPPNVALSVNQGTGLKLTLTGAACLCQSSHSSLSPEQTLFCSEGSIHYCHSSPLPVFTQLCCWRPAHCRVSQSTTNAFVSTWPQARTVLLSLKMLNQSTSSMCLLCDDCSGPWIWGS